MNFSIATVTISGIAPYSQSRLHGEPMLEGESHDDYDERTWRHKLNTEERDGKLTVVLPAHGIHQSIIAAARYSKRQIVGQGKATWTKKFEAGISIPENPALNIEPTDDKLVRKVVILSNADGVRGSGKRVPRRFPSVARWQATFDVWILDPIITEEIFRDMLVLAGMYVGLGRFRPEKGGTNGRFKLEKLTWKDNRALTAA
jgi:hypothetical protein